MSTWYGARTLSVPLRNITRRAASNARAADRQTLYKRPCLTPAVPCGELSTRWRQVTKETLLHRDPNTGIPQVRQ